MKPVEKIENSLQRLVPAPLSRQASESLDSLIDSLAAGQADPAVDDERRSSGSRGRPAAWLAIAAALAIGAFGAIAAQGWLAPDSGRPERPLATTAPAAPAVGGLEWVGHTKRVGEPEDGGLVADENGRMHRLLRYRVMEEEIVRDGRNGSVMRVGGPRDEVMLVPVSTF